MKRVDALALLKRLHQAQSDFYAGRGDGAAVRRLLTNDVEWHVPGSNAIAGSYYGTEQVMGYSAKRRDMARGTFRMNPGEVMVGQEHVAVLTDGHAVINGVERSWSTLGLYRIKDGRIAACWLLPLEPQTFDEAWGTGPANRGDREGRPSGP
jgi:ketosteroid isomerase-like protein